MKREKNKKKQKNWKKKTPKTGRNWMILKEIGKKQEETGRNRKKPKETVRNSKKQ